MVQSLQYNNRLNYEHIRMRFQDDAETVTCNRKISCQLNIHVLQFILSFHWLSIWAITRTWGKNNKYTFKKNSIQIHDYRSDYEMRVPVTVLDVVLWGLTTSVKPKIENNELKTILWLSKNFWFEAHGCSEMTYIYCMMVVQLWRSPSKLKMVTFKTEGQGEVSLLC